MAAKKKPCSACAQARQRAEAQRKSALSVKNMSSNDFGLSQLLTMLTQIESLLQRGLIYRNQWVTRLSKKRKQIEAHYPQRLPDFDTLIKNIETLDQISLLAEVTRIKTITSRDDYTPRKGKAV